MFAVKCSFYYLIQLLEVVTTLLRIKWLHHPITNTQTVASFDVMSHGMVYEHVISLSLSFKHFASHMEPAISWCEVSEH